MDKRQSLTASAAGIDPGNRRAGGHARPASPSEGEHLSEAGHLALSVQAWQGYRAGERASASNTGAQCSASGAMGGRQAGQSRADTDMNPLALWPESIAAALSAAAIPPLRPAWPPRPPIPCKSCAQHARRGRQRPRPGEGGVRRLPRLGAGEAPGPEHGRRRARVRGSSCARTPNTRPGTSEREVCRGPRSPRLAA